MRHRIRTIAWLLVACVLGINGFQAYWLYSTYELTTKQFDRAAHDALVAAVQQQLIATTTALKGQGVELILTGTSSSQVGPRRVVFASAVTVIPKSVSRREAVSIGRHLDHIIIDDWGSGERLCLADLTRTYQQQLNQRAVTSTTLLDTFSLNQAGTTYKRRSLPTSTLNRFTRQTPPVLLSPKRGLYVRAYLTSPTQYLWQRLSGLLGGSVLLLLLTSGCFVLVLYTMIGQRKLAEAKNDFINNMTHELKTPLTTVTAAIETLERFGLQAESQKIETYFRISKTELRRLSDLVDKVLSIAIKERQALVLHLEPVHPAELIQDAIHKHQLQASKLVHFEVAIDPAEVVQADRLHLNGVINNLIDNAIKYSHEHVIIKLRSYQAAGGWQLTVQDDGIGIATTYQTAVFDRFFRVPTGNLHPVKGFGLGLYYVRQIIERHGGHIALRSALGRGSTFTLWLPQS